MKLLESAPIRWAGLIGSYLTYLTSTLAILTILLTKMRTMTKRRILVVSDLQVPYQHEKAVSNLIKLTRKEKFDQVLCVGDELDMQSQSKWAKNTPLEFEGQLDADREACKNILWELGVTDVTRSNHTDRLYHTLLRGAPSLIGLPELDYPKFMGFCVI